MAYNIRRVGAVAPNSVGPTELQTSAVTAEKIAPLAVITEKIAVGAIVTEKIAVGAVETDKIKDLAITAIKASNDVKLKTYVGDETETQSGTDLAEKEFHFVKNSKNDWKTVRIITSLKTSDSNYPAMQEVYINGDATASIVFDSIETDYEFLDEEIDISGLGNGKHKITVKLISDGAVAYSDFLDVGLIP